MEPFDDDNDTVLNDIQRILTEEYGYDNIDAESRIAFYLSATKKVYKKYVEKQVSEGQAAKESYYIDKVHELVNEMSLKRQAIENDLLGSNTVAMLKMGELNKLRAEFDEYKRENEKMAEDYMSIEVQMFEDRIAKLTAERNQYKQILDSHCIIHPDFSKSVVTEEIKLDNLKEFTF